MITIKNYSLEPYTTGNTPPQNFDTEWLRKAVNKLMLNKRKILEEQGVDTSLFFNHNPKTGENRQGYPLIIYHYINGLFYITGINEGAFALEKLANQYDSPFPAGEILFKQFRKEKDGGEFNPGTIDNWRTYKLVEWRPIHHERSNAFNQMGLGDKANELNIRLEKQLTNELGRDLGISFDGLKLKITNITLEYKPVTFKGHDYTAYDIQFSANIALPKKITLGNQQAWGYGRVEPL